jgi:ACR3 family arsenite transporter
MTRAELERRQVWIYLGAILAGLAAGTFAPALGPAAEASLWPALMLLLTVSFSQVPLDEVPAALRDRRFIGAVLVGNFVLVPCLVWLLLPLAPDDPAARLGMLLVLLVPCTDWFITFAQLGRGDARRAIVATPVKLLVQIAALPAFLWLFLGEGFAEILSAGRFLLVFVMLIVVPLGIALLVERWAARRGLRDRVVGRLGSFPVPLLALVVFLIALGQAEIVAGEIALLGRIAPVFVLYLVGAAAIGITLGRMLALPVPQARTLVFSLATRNSFVVLPFALALPAGWEAAVLVIVFQSLVELFGMVAFLWLVPNRLLRMPAGA